MKKRLLGQGERFSFFQAMRLLRRLAQNEGVEQPALKTRPNVSLHFPGTDLSAIEEVAPGKFKLTANFLGLYGVTSPLPNFYSERILDEHHDGYHSNRDFLDIVSQTIYPLFFRAWLKPRAHLRIQEFGDDRLLEILHTFVGINEPLKLLQKPGFNHLLRFAGLFSQFPRSAMGLRTIIAALYPDAEVEVVQQDELWQTIPVQQRMLLGEQACTLGEDSHTGSLVRSRRSNLTLKIHQLEQSLFLSLLPGAEEFNKLSLIVRYYLFDPLHVRLELQLRPGAAQPVQLGAPHKNWLALGRDTWLTDENARFPAQVRVTL